MTQADSAAETPLRWLQPTWRHAAIAWIDEQLRDLGRRRVGEVEQSHVRPWSTAMRVRTDDGVVWFKADGDGPAYEVRLLDALTRWRVPYVLLPLALDVDRAWVLLPDGGTTLRTVLADDRDLTQWEAVLRAYAELQRSTAGHRDDLLRAGVPDLQLDRLTGTFSDLLEDDQAMMVGLDGGLTDEGRRRLRAQLTTFQTWCSELAAIGIPSTIEHSDLHDANVFDGPDRITFFDWGDASVGHPFASMLVTLRSIGHSFELAPGDARLRRLSDCYLEAWTDSFDGATLRRALELAVRVGIVSRAASWHRAFLGVPLSQRGDYSDAVPGWLLEVLEAPVL